MRKKRNLFVVPATIFQIILLVLMSFAVAFLFSEEVGVGGTNNKYKKSFIGVRKW